MDDFLNKIMKLEEIIKVTEKFPRKKKIILCHGVFDIVHPGHMRHLFYAKKKADILIVSTTNDKFIKKGKYRPHVPQNIRLQNLAAFEFVDYVFVDDNKEPYDSLRHLKPDYFAKGFEYSEGNVNTEKEISILKEYGGKILFTPGDIVYSSSRLLESNLPKLRIEKLQNVMNACGLSLDKIISHVMNFKKKKIHVVGDTIIDSLTECTMLGASGKTPTLSVQFQNQTNFVGGAGIVAKHLASTGSEVVFTTVMGNDELSKFAEKDLSNSNIKLNIIRDDLRPTTNKNAIVVGDYRMIKIDKIDNRVVDFDLQEKIQNFIKKTETDCIIFSDFRHGIFTKENIPMYIESINKNAFKVADSQVASRWGNILDFKNFDLITPNEKEARFSLGDQETGVRPLTSILIKNSLCKNLILKLGSRGSMAANQKEFNDEIHTLDSFTDNAIDPVGSGDALLAYSTLSLLHKDCIGTASIIGSLAAAIECEKNGNIPVTVDEVIKKIQEIKL